MATTLNCTGSLLGFPGQFIFLLFSTFSPLLKSQIPLPPYFLLLLLLLSRFSCVRLCATPEMAAHQALPSLGFSRQEHRSGLPLPSPLCESESESEVAQSHPSRSDPMDCSLPGSSIHGIFQARVLEWLAIAFSGVPYYLAIKKSEIMLFAAT